MHLVLSFLLADVAEDVLRRALVLVVFCLALEYLLEMSFAVFLEEFEIIFAMVVRCLELFGLNWV